MLKLKTFKILIKISNENLTEHFGKNNILELTKIYKKLENLEIK